MIVWSLQCTNFNLSLRRLNDPITLFTIRRKMRLHVFYLEMFAMLNYTFYKLQTWVSYLQFLVEVWHLHRDTRQRSWLRYYAVSRKVAGSIPVKFAEIFNWCNPSSRTMTLGSIRPLTDMSTSDIPRGKARPACKADNLTAICEPIV
jgi:hypothetical protein